MLGNNEAFMGNNSLLFSNNEAFFINNNTLLVNNRALLVNKKTQTEKTAPPQNLKTRSITQYNKNLFFNILIINYFPVIYN